MPDQQTLLHCLHHTLQGTSYSVEATRDGARAWGTLDHATGLAANRAMVAVEMELDAEAGTARIIERVHSGQRTPVGQEHAFDRGAGSYKKVVWQPGERKQRLDAGDLRSRVVTAVRQAGWQPLEDPVAGVAGRIGLVVGLFAAGLTVLALLVSGALSLLS
ncbi:hypothetical protein FHX37_1686 [Haloactinospora alba]|uniref:Uncharacterized protein n=1 Tax=Haloactinospora alba TaxID=405555 RepID=A0A543NIU5_9ACTN|nr:hypothetical protein [Haloactinospora alba]TQN31765.1 hypothetical protein FHX37_1686 [Haloactinospora alba]